MCFQVLNEDSVCLCISDTSLLPLLAAKAGAKQVGVTLYTDLYLTTLINIVVSGVEIS